ncbi:hypothetical protein [Solidesulfovibrio alcoholivorans]|uniref:hypothetical protein n=1 Tax=Solidesulfovibrio alcoholivorans TaxID=81406 RepID=UPI0004972932|nr:hypothetical protein [Solidesulfovibrio alcoholivorans]
MNPNVLETQAIPLAAIRPILSDDISKNKIDRIMMALRGNDPDRKSIDLTEIRPLLLEDFSEAEITRVMMALKLSQANPN